MKRRMIQSTQSVVGPSSSLNIANKRTIAFPLVSNLMGTTPVPRRGYYSYEMFELNNYFDTKEFPSNYPQIHLCKNDPMLMIYLSLVKSKSIRLSNYIYVYICTYICVYLLLHKQLRDKDTKDMEKFRVVTQKILTLMFNQMLQYHYCEIGQVGEGDSMGNSTIESTTAMELMSTFRSQPTTYFPLTFSQTTKQTPFDSPFACVAGDRGLYGVALSDSGEHALRTVLQSFHPIIKSVVGTLKVEESFTQDKDGIIRSNRQAVAIMPKDIKSRIVLLFHPVIVQNELHSGIDALLRVIFSTLFLCFLFFTHQFKKKKKKKAGRK
ncbi:hypothetical protein RFI_26072 [Reticulomyxa filosa]|uniref:Uncharacterized protein n=1 Tax=Reticulomyxa filosa TaxID=46433 RepID=X6MCX8_RETFI|nr:hypothetical protein RFI_26072 [Reticulomyxa filosa]|eukprot:ETO11307.1 hypothetical protein RFI_26072 [Reticulomyxa filosa]